MHPTKEYIFYKTIEHLTAMVEELPGTYYNAIVSGIPQDHYDNIVADNMLTSTTNDTGKYFIYTGVGFAVIGYLQ